jgi:hypothetical protein
MKICWANFRVVLNIKTKITYQLPGHFKPCLTAIDLIYGQAKIYEEYTHKARIDAWSERS